MPRTVVRSTRVTHVLLIAALLALPAPVRAQTAQDRAIAERLFLEGRALMQDKAYERACAKFDESYRRDHEAMGTLLNLALCHEQLGRVASAWSEFRVVAAESRGKREDRSRLAEEHAARLMNQLSYLAFDVPRDALGLAISLDGVVLGAASLETEIPVDPGERTIEATAPGKIPFRSRVVVGPNGDKKRVAIPPLADAKPPNEAPPAPAPPRAQAQVETRRDDASVEAARTRRVTGFTVAGIGAVVIGMGAFFGVRAIGRYADAKNACPGDVCGSAADLSNARALVDDAKTSARLANVTIGLGVAALVGGVLLVLLSGPSGQGSATAGRLELGGTP
jgi:hypothetical protein